jgi:hypothetical protein
MEMKEIMMTENWKLHLSYFKVIIVLMMLVGILYLFAKMNQNRNEIVVGDDGSDIQDDKSIDNYVKGL